MAGAWGVAWGSSFGNSFGYLVTVTTKAAAPSVSGGDRISLQGLYKDTYKVKTLEDAEELKRLIEIEDDELIEIIITMVQADII